jgi:replicative superfamily II helicase
MHVKKLHSLTVGNSKFINDIGLVLMKELQCLTDEEHGQVLKLLLTRILSKQK